MRRIIEFLFLIIIIGTTLLDHIQAEVTHEEIRGNIQSLIYSYNQLDNKLERHEHRERALGELLKKALHALQKGQKNLEPINGIFTRLDERVSEIETMLITQEEKYNIQTEKLGETLEHIFKWMRENDECYKRPPVLQSIDNTPPLESSNPVPIVPQQEVFNKKIQDNLETLSKQITELVNVSNKMMEQNEKTLQNTPTVEMITELSNKLKPSDTKSSLEQFSRRFDDVVTKIEELRSAFQETQETWHPDGKEFIHGLANETLNAIENVKIDILTASDKGFAKTASRIKETEEGIQNDVSKIFDSVTDSADVLEKFYQEVNSSYNKLNEGVEVFDKFNNILMTNSEILDDTQRKVEFSSLQIVQKITELLEKQRDEIVLIVKDNINETVIVNQMDTIQNLSAVIESEISHVWHQIANIHAEIADSKDLLTLIQGRNEVYVNSTFSNLDSMGKKVDDIKGRMLDVDSNLNFLLGRLSVISQEFKNIKIGLAESLDALRNTFHSMQEKLPSQGAAGPHTIAKNEYETELNLLEKRHTTT